jgi:phosphatidylglycerophosphate synthase
LRNKSYAGAIWAKRGAGFDTTFSRVTISHSAALVAIAASFLGMTPNHLTLLSCLAGIAAFITAFLLPTDQPVISILVLFVIASFAFVLDCADGILARGTNRATRFGGFFDHTLDVVTQTCGLAAIFVFAYRSGLASNNTEFANAALVTGFIFLLIREARNFSIHLYQATFSPKRVARNLPRIAAIATGVIKSLLTYQFSMLAVLVYLASPIASFAMFGVQTAVIFVSLVRCIGRARRLESSMSADGEE